VCNHSKASKQHAEKKTAKPTGRINDHTKYTNFHVIITSAKESVCSFIEFVCQHRIQTVKDEFS